MNHDKRRYPLLCRLRGHRWYQKPGRTAWYRDGSCVRCASIRAPRRERPPSEWPPIARIWTIEPAMSGQITGDDLDRLIPPPPGMSANDIVDFLRDQKDRR